MDLIEKKMVTSYMYLEEFQATSPLITGFSRSFVVYAAASLLVGAESRDLI